MRELRKESAFFVIPSAARDLLSYKFQEEAGSSGKPRPRNDNLGVFRGLYEAKASGVMSEGGEFWMDTPAMLRRKKTVPQAQ
jgi:hypothetical protein